MRWQPTGFEHADDILHLHIKHTDTHTKTHKHSKAVTRIQVKNYFALFQFQFHRKILEIITNCVLDAIAERTANDQQYRYTRVTGIKQSQCQS